MLDPVKLVIFDLDGTLWDGILLEDGLAGIHLREAMAQAVRTLSERGILCSVCSRNHLPDVQAALQHHGLWEYFVFPQVGWEPKSQAVARILRAVRFAPGACVFVDDTPFEREEVAQSHPELTVFSPEAFLEASGGARFAVSCGSAEARSRRQFYQEEEVRQKAEEAYTGTFRQFLAESGLAVELGVATDEALERIVELVQRTNQINFSTHRYERGEVEALLASRQHRAYVLSARDRFGAYGLVGFACLALDARGTALVQDLMLSCRIQGRGVEAAAIAGLARLARDLGMGRLVGVYRPTRRNGHIQSVYANLGFTPLETQGEEQRFELTLGGNLPAVPAHVQLTFSDDVTRLGEEGIPAVRSVVARLAAEGRLRGRILDVGAGWDAALGEGCDRWLVQGGGAHVRLDLEKYPRTDIVANAQEMPEVESEGYDHVLCLEVLEHCTNPFELSAELLRVLKPGGLAVVSAPMNYVIHDHPGDYWRFTPDGLKLLLRKGTRLVEEVVEGESDHPVRTVVVVEKQPRAH